MYRMAHHRTCPTQKPYRGESPHRGKCPYIGENPCRGERQCRGESPYRRERQCQGESSYRRDHQCREESPYRGERQRRGESPYRGERQRRGESPYRGGPCQGESPYRGERQRRGESPYRGDPCQGESPYRGDPCKGESPYGGERQRRGESPYRGDPCQGESPYRREDLFRGEHPYRGAGACQGETPYGTEVPYIRERPCRGEPQKMNYISHPTLDTLTKFYERIEKQKFPEEVDSYEFGDDPCTTCQKDSGHDSSYNSCHRDSGHTQCSYGPEETDSGFFHSIRNGFQRIFTGKKGDSNTGCTSGKDKVNRYSSMQLKYISQLLDKMGDEIGSMRRTIKDGFSNCNDQRSSLRDIMDRLEDIKNELSYAYESYDSGKSRSEYHLICTLLERVQSFRSRVKELFMELDRLEYQFNRNDNSSSSDARCCKPCCTKRQDKPINRKDVYKYNKVPYDVYPNSSDVNCQKPCCAQTSPQGYDNARRKISYPKQTYDVRCNKNKPSCNRPRRRNNRLNNTTSAIPVGVMLVKL